MPFIPFSGAASGLAGTVKKRFRIKYFPPDLHIRDRFGFPEPVKRPVTDVQQLLNVCAVIISGAAGLFFVQTFKNFGKENQECPFKLFFIGERMIEFVFIVVGLLVKIIVLPHCNCILYMLTSIECELLSAYTTFLPFPQLLLTVKAQETINHCKHSMNC